MVTLIYKWRKTMIFTGSARNKHIKPFWKRSRIRLYARITFCFEKCTFFPTETSTKNHKIIKSTKYNKHLFTLKKACYVCDQECSKSISHSHKVTTSFRHFLKTWWIKKYNKNNIFFHRSVILYYLHFIIIFYWVK